jgi:hypothetical protein
VVQVDPASPDSRIAGYLAVAVHDAAGAVIGGHFLFFVGGSVSTVSVLQAWPAGSATEVARLPAARSDLSAATLHGTTYLVGGFDGSAMTPDVLATTHGVSFRRVAQLAIPVRYAAVAGLGSALWVVGGVTSTVEGGTTETDAVQKVDLVSGGLLSSAGCPSPRATPRRWSSTARFSCWEGVRGPLRARRFFVWIQRLVSSRRPAGHLPGPISDAGAVVVNGVGYLVAARLPVQPSRWTRLWRCARSNNAGREAVRTSRQGRHRPI